MSHRQVPTRLPRSVPLTEYRRTLAATRRFRTNFVFGMLLAFFCLMLLRLGKLQIVDAEVYREKALASQFVSHKFRPRRGRILDRHGHVMATGRPALRVDLDPRTIVEPTNKIDPRTFSVLLSDFLGGEPGPDEIYRRIDRSRRFAEAKGVPVPQYAPLVSKVEDPLIVDRLEAFRFASRKGKQSMGLYGAVVSTVEGRLYPNGSYAAHVLGKVPQGKRDARVGIEGTYHERLRGEEVRRRIGRDAGWRRLASPSTMRGHSSRGEDVILTIDLVVQFYLESALDEMIAEHKSLHAWGIVMDVKSGEVLAMASRPTFDPNTQGYGSMNYAIQGMYEPGSCFKPFTVALALRDKKVGPNDNIAMPPRRQFEGDPHPVTDSHPVGDGTIERLIAHSSNTGAAELGHRLGADRMRQWIRFLFRPAHHARNKRGTGLGIAQEKGFRPRKRRWTLHDAHRSSFGQGFSVTPMQLAMAFSAFARDDGRMVRPRIVLTTDPVQRSAQRVVGKREREVIRRGLLSCTTEGTAANAFVGCLYDVAGKTGTSQQPGRLHAREVKLRGEGVVGAATKLNICSFAGFAPAARPEVLVYIGAKQLKEDEVSGGKVAAPAVREVIEKTLAYWRVPARPTVTAEFARGGQGESPDNVLPALRGSR